MQTMKAQTQTLDFYHSLYKGGRLPIHSPVVTIGVGCGAVISVVTGFLVIMFTKNWTEIGTLPVYV